jgi:outer membrane receptor protein involved in Fe transport
MRNARKPQAQHRPARLPLAIAICFAISSTAFAQDSTTPAPAAPAPADSSKTAPANDGKAAPTLGAVTVTAQKREENLQKVPISIQVLGNTQLEQQNVNSFADYAKLLPAVSIQPAGMGFGQVYMRGVASGSNGNHSGPLPSVGIYLDEEPITTIQGALDVHMYDIARVEALAGPQGTLYGASSQSGTIRIITNKPDPSGFAAGYGLELNSIDHGGMGYVEEGFVNIPMGDKAAIRLVGWNKRDAGFIDNVLGSRTFPTWDQATGGHGTLTNTSTARNNYNDAQTTGARAALKIDFSEDWTATAQVMGQRTRSNGNFAYDPAVGYLQITHFYPENADDRWMQAALTVQGKIGNFDVTYAYSHLARHDTVNTDYSDYSFWYDTLYGYGAYWYDNNYDIINPSQHIQGRDGYSKTSHELRFASPVENRIRFVGGLFWQTQTHDITQRYKIDNFADFLSVTGWPDTIWLTQQQRSDHDEAVFGELSFDITDQLTGTVGLRHYKYNNGLEGFFGFSRGYSPTPDPADYPGGVNDPDYIAKIDGAYGEAKCELLYGPNSSTWTKFRDAPCEIFNKQVKDSGNLKKANLTWKINDTKMVYVTWSEGYRPGGLNRRGTLPPYQADFLTNYEFGWKTSWLDNRVTFNGSVFREDWKDFQFAVLGLNGLTDIRNAAQAQIQGIEGELAWAVNYSLTLSGGFAFYDPKLTANFCGWLNPTTGKSETVCPAGTVNPITGDVVDGPQAPKGSQLPVTSKFKGNLTARYTWDIGEYEAYWQGTFVHEGKRTNDLRLLENSIYGNSPAYNTFDFAIGVKKNNWSVDLFIKNAFDQHVEYGRFVDCPETVCGNRPSGDPVYPVPPQYANGQVYRVPGQPRTIGLRFEQTF